MFIDKGFQDIAGEKFEILITPINTKMFVSFLMVFENQNLSVNNKSSIFEM